MHRIISILFLLLLTTLSPAREPERATPSDNHSIADNHSITGNHGITANNSITGNNSITDNHGITGNHSITAKNNIAGNHDITGNHSITDNHGTTDNNSITGNNVIDATLLPVFGQAFEASPEHPFRRLPESLKGVVRDPVWQLGCKSAGLYVRFRSNAPEIHARWTNTGYHMPHMTDCGTGGLDLYALLDGGWRYVGSGFDGEIRAKSHERRLVGNMEPRMREYMLYLSLYDEVMSLELRVPEGYVIEEPRVPSPASESPMVMYGTSILQGGCANRPGMAFTNILARRFDRTVINLGFSGNAFLDYEIAELMASVQTPSVFVLDYVPNASAQMIREKGERFFRIIRDAHPDVPVIFVEDPSFAHSVVDQAIAREIAEKNAAQLELFRKLQDGGEKLIYYVPSEGMTGGDGEAFVDGVHLTDLGMVRYADHLGKTLELIFN